MTMRSFRSSAEGFAISSAVFGVLLAALLAQTKVLAFATFTRMAIILVIADVGVYLMMKAGLIRSPASRGQRS